MKPSYRHRRSVREHGSSVVPSSDPRLPHRASSRVPGLLPSVSRALWALMNPAGGFDSHRPGGFSNSTSTHNNSLPASTLPLFGSSANTLPSHPLPPNTSTPSSGTYSGGPPWGSASSMSWGVSASVAIPPWGTPTPASSHTGSAAPGSSVAVNTPWGTSQSVATTHIPSAPPPQPTVSFGVSANVLAPMTGGPPTGPTPSLSHPTTPQSFPGPPSHPKTLPRDDPTVGASPVAPEPSVSHANEELARLKARIEEKKQRLVEQRRRKEQTHTSSSTTTTTTTNNNNNNAGATGMHQDNHDTANHQNNHKTHQQQPNNNNNNHLRATSLAQRNALRFAPVPRTTPSHDDPPHHNQPTATTASGIAATERNELHRAVSLVGTCRDMCPPEERHRRDAEGDVPLLELPRPNSLHPAHWTLRETAVKRFRRSAADYKLDVPEWVRPPDVLETVMGYLEEWVMERDRQGGDPRYPHNGVPPSLDVYQYIWDRTRMVRKDFILQNYVGTGGQCDARAVRCHERIARWHAMCEHQLSHLPDFVKAQSQQNISELGQTLKSLNQFYDDSLRRATKNVPDQQGRETRTEWDGPLHGCQQETVQGNDPVDYDGTPLNNVGGKARLIGSNETIGAVTNGTAEAEMRGLYILLTIDNDGGMEVLKYVGRLYKERPDIYRSSHVQLAMNVFMARREYNYARFFSILRSPDTPYLFACLMFKHVELMRKSAFRIMSKTYGGRSKDNEPIYDAYALKALADLLCFESMEEARHACEHYGITVAATKVKMSSGTVIEDIIYWRRSSFREPKDEEKGTAIPLPPNKMVKTIESKLCGATRLAVCRGQVSQCGAGHFPTDVHPVAAKTMVPEAEDPGKDEYVRQKEKDEYVRQKEIEQLRTQAEAEQLARAQAEREAEERARQLEDEQKRLQSEAMIRREQEAARQAEEARLLAERKAMQEAEAKARKAEDEQRRKEAEELACRRAALANEERLRRLAEAQEGERLRKIAEARAQHEREEKARAREKARQEEAEKARLAAVKERLRLEELAREESEWKARRQKASAIVFMRRWIQKFPKHLLEGPDDDIGGVAPISNDVLRSRAGHGGLLTHQAADDESPGFQLRRAVEACLTVQARLPLARWSFEALRSARCTQPSTVLMNIAVRVPGRQALDHLVRTWILSRLQCDRHVQDGMDIRVSLTFIDGNIDEQPFDGVLALERGTADPWLEAYYDSSIPTVVVKLVPDEEKFSNSVEIVSCPSLSPDLLETTLRTGLKNLFSKLSQFSQPSVGRISLSQICFALAASTVEVATNLESSDDLLKQVAVSLATLVDQLDSFALQDQYCLNWPSSSFARGSRIASYFENGDDLPIDWKSCLKRQVTEPFVSDVADCLGRSLEETVDALLSDAPQVIHSESRARLLARDHRSALQVAFRWRQERPEEPPHIFIPYGMLSDILKETLRLSMERIKEDYADSRHIPKLPYSLLQFNHFLADELAIRTLECKASLQVERDSARIETPKGVKRSIGDGKRSASRSSSGRAEKRRRQLLNESVAVDVEESRSFTKKLEAYLRGKESIDMMVGSWPLSFHLGSADDLEHA